jgi:hypothetical protein
MVRSSQARRSGAGSLTGNRGNRDSNRLPASGNRDNNHDEGSNGAPPEPRPGDSGRGSSDERQERRGHSNGDREGTEDPGNRKRKLYEDITEAVSSGSLFKKLNTGYAFL